MVVSEGLIAEKVSRRQVRIREREKKGKRGKFFIYQYKKIENEISLFLSPSLFLFIYLFALLLFFFPYFPRWFQVSQCHRFNFFLIVLRIFDVKNFKVVIRLVDWFIAWIISDGNDSSVLGSLILTKNWRI